jgi:hypothetical protein
MATKKIASSQDIYQIKVTLLGTKPRSVSTTLRHAA